MKIKEKLAQRLRKEFNLNVSADDFQRTYAGVHMRSGGAFLWMFTNPKISGTVGGCEPASKYIVKKNKLKLKKNNWNEIEVYAYSPGEPGYEDAKERE